MDACRSSCLLWLSSSLYLSRSHSPLHSLSRTGNRLRSVCLPSLLLFPVAAPSLRTKTEREKWKNALLFSATASLVVTLATHLHPTPSTATAGKMPESTSSQYVYLDLRTGGRVQPREELSATAATLMRLISSFQARVAKQLGPEEQEEQLFTRLRTNLSAAIAQAASRDPDPEVPCNGIRTLIRQTLTFFRIASHRKRESEVRAFLSVVRVLDSWFSVVVRILPLKSMSE